MGSGVQTILGSHIVFTDVICQNAPCCQNNRIESEKTHSKFYYCVGLGSPLTTGPQHRGTCGDLIYATAHE